MTLRKFFDKYEEVAFDGDREEELMVEHKQGVFRGIKEAAHRETIKTFGELLS